jgi:hypothetical protein
MSTSPLQFYQGRNCSRLAGPMPEQRLADDRREGPFASRTIYLLAMKTDTRKVSSSQDSGVQGDNTRLGNTA